MKNSQSGMTMVETLIALSIVGVMTSVSVPPMSNFVEASRADSDTVNLFTSLLLARSESVRRNSMVSLCKIDPVAPTFCDNSKGWPAGWIAIVDDDADGVRDAGEEILETSTGMSAQTMVAATNYANSISYLPSGGISSNGSFNICVNGNVANAIVINATGRPRITESAC